jgi:hypothetical protein
MLFGRAPAKENIPLSELEAYLDRCFDGKLRRLSTRMPEIESALNRSFTDFERAVREFSKSTAAPDMENLYGLKENNLKSQKENYSSSLLHLLSPPPKYGGRCLYLKAKDALGSYSSFITGIMKVNSSFRLAMIAYAGELTGVKRHFTSMERLCKELGNEINLCSLEENEYRKIGARINAMLEDVSEISALGKSSESRLLGISSDEGALGDIQKRLKEKELRVETARHGHREADSGLARLLLPVERVARKHDHMSVAKVKLTEYLKDPTERIRTAEDANIIYRHLSEIADEIREGKIDAKNSTGLVSQIDAIRNNDLLLLAESSRTTASELKNSETELAELRTQLRALEKSQAEKRRAAEEKTHTEHEMGLKRAHLSSEKKELEQLFLSCYKKQVEILLP